MQNITKLCLAYGSSKDLSKIGKRPEETTSPITGIKTTVNSRYCGHPGDLKFVSVIAGVRNSEVQKKIPQFYF